MKTRKIKNISLVLGLWILCTSCEKLVEVDLPINQLNTEQVFESTATADGALSALYSEMQASSVLSGGASGVGCLLGSYADDLDGYDIYSVNASMDIYNNIQLSTNTTVKMIWANAYREIYMANSIIAGIVNSSSIEEKDKQRIKAEAVFLRSIIYFYLTQLYGDIPFSTSTDYNINQALSKSPSEIVLDTIAKDLEDVVPMLENDYRNTERIYVNRKTAEILLATIYVHQKKWTNAENLLTQIIQSPLYNLQQDISKIFKKDGKHIVWQLKPIYEGTATPEALLYGFSSGVPRYYAASDNLISIFSDNDERKEKWLTPVVSNQKNYYKIDKYQTLTANTDEYSIVFRIQEAYLLLAEVLAEENKIEESLFYINQIRQIAGLSLLSGSISQNQLKNEISIEYQREFFSERGIRFLNLKRNNKLDSLLNTKPNWKSYNEVWPLPASELLLNPNLNPQNTGY